MPVIGSTSSQRQHSVSVGGLQGVWAKASGGAVTVDVSESYNGGAKVPDLTKGRPKVANVTVDRPYNPGRDAAVISFIVEHIGGTWETTITDQDLDANEIAIGAPVVYSGCVPVSVTGPEYNEESSDASRIVVEFRVRSRT